MKPVLPPGRYIANIVRRKEIPQGQRGGVELTFRVDVGEYAGELVSMRLWAPGRIERADRLSPGDAVEIVVGNRDTSSGRRFSTVHDFRGLNALTAADAVRGKDEAISRAKQGDDRPAPGTFQPHPLLTERDLEEVFCFSDDEPYLCTDAPFPLLDDDTVERVRAAARSADDATLASIDDAPDACDADEDAAEHRWIITRTGSNGPLAALLEDEKNPPPLHVSPANATVPLRASLFRYTADLPSYMAAHHQSVRGYSGLAWSQWLPLRLLCHDDLDTIHERARLVAVACAKLGVPHEQIVVVNNWNDDLTLLIPSCAANAVPQVGYDKVAGHFVQALADLALMDTFDVPKKTFWDGLKLPQNPMVHARIDRQLYGPVAVHPALNSPDDSGKLFAVAVSYDELISLDTAKIKALAKSPRPVPRPTWRANEVEELVSLWEYAVEAERLRSNRFSWITTDDPFVHADTLDWLHHGSDLEAAPKRLFRAAVNLMRLGCSQGAVLALLHPAAHLSGLSRGDVTWGVECAAKALVPEGFYLDDDDD